MPFKVENPWLNGATDVATYVPEELLSTKLRALYQRRKGEDLFDVWYAVDKGRANPLKLLDCFQRYMIKFGLAVPRQYWSGWDEGLRDPATNKERRFDTCELLPGSHNLQGSDV